MIMRRIFAWESQLPSDHVLFRLVQSCRIFRDPLAQLAKNAWETLNKPSHLRKVLE